MIVVGCPVCRDEVLAPSGLAVEAKVRCPLCLNEFELGDAFRELPPSLIVLDAPDAPAFQLDTTHAVAASAGPVGQDEAPAFEFEEGSAPVRPRVQVRHHSTPPKKKNLVFEVVKIVLGGILGLGIGQFLLWRMPGDWPSHQRDPFHIGERYGNVFPVSLLAPLEIRDPDAVEDDGEDDGVDLDAATRSLSPLAGASRLNDRRSPGNQDDAEEASTEFMDDPVYDSEYMDGTGDLGYEGMDDGGDDDDGTGDLPELPGIRRSPRVTGSELDRAVTEARAAADAWNADSSSEATTQLVSSLDQLARSVTFIYPARSVPRATEQALREFLPAFGQDGRDVIFKSRQRQGAAEAFVGEVIVGEVTGIRASGLLYETSVIVDGQSVRVMSRDDPRDRFRIDDRVMVLAVVVPQPKTQLAGVGNVAGPVYFGEFTLRISSTSPSTSTTDDQGTDADSRSGSSEVESTDVESSDVESSEVDASESDSSDVEDSDSDSDERTGDPENGTTAETPE